MRAFAAHLAPGLPRLFKEIPARRRPIVQIVEARRVTRYLGKIYDWIYRRVCVPGLSERPGTKSIAESVMEAVLEPYVELITELAADRITELIVEFYARCNHEVYRERSAREVCSAV